MSHMTLPVTHFFFFFNDPATTAIYTLSLHDALPIFTDSVPELILPICSSMSLGLLPAAATRVGFRPKRSEEHTSELQSHHDLVCRLLLEKKKQKDIF